MRDISGSLRRQSLAVALVCLVCDATLFVFRGPLPDGGWRAWSMLAAGIVANLALAGAARHAGWVSLAQALLMVVSPVLLSRYNVYDAATNSGILIAGFRSGAWLRRPAALLALAVMLAGVTASDLISRGAIAHNWLLLLASVAMTGLLPWLVGRYTTERRAYIADLERAAEERRQHEEAAVRRAVAEERTAIARDLHDVISHHVSAIGVHAGAARLGLPAEGEPAVRRALGAVESASRSAMADLRRMLDLLHAKDKDDAGRQPGLENLDELLETLRAAGLPTHLTLHGEPGELPGSLDVALYRIAQEALTNAMRHGEGPVEVDLEHRRTEVVLTVVNRTTGVSRVEPDDETHRGLAGIRRRVALFAGQVEYGDENGLWRICARFPVESPVESPVEGT